MTPPSTEDYCPNNGPFEFIPIEVGAVFLNSTLRLNFTEKQIGYKPCYPTMEVQFMPHAPDGSQGGDNWGYMHFTRPAPRSLACGDWYSIGTKYSHRFLEVSVAHSVVKKMHVNITYLPGELEDIRRNGVSLLIAPCGITGTVTSTLHTASLFTEKNAAKAAKLNIDFLTARGLFGTFEPFGKITAIDISTVHSGDNLQVLKLDGLDPLIAWGTGGRTGHTTIAVWQGTGQDRQLWICESTGMLSVWSINRCCA